MTDRLGNFSIAFDMTVKGGQNTLKKNGSQCSEA